MASKGERFLEDLVKRLRQKRGHAFAEHVERTCAVRAERVDRKWHDARQRGSVAQRRARQTTPFEERVHPHDVELMRCYREFAKNAGLAGAVTRKRKRRR